MSALDRLRSEGSQLDRGSNPDRPWLVHDGCPMAVYATTCTIVHTRGSAMLARSEVRGGGRCDRTVSEKSRKMVTAKKKVLHQPRSGAFGAPREEQCTRARARPGRPAGRPSSLMGCSGRETRAWRPPARAAAARRAGACAGWRRQCRDEDVRPDAITCGLGSIKPKHEQLEHCPTRKVDTDRQREHGAGRGEPVPRVASSIPTNRR